MRLQDDIAWKVILKHLTNEAQAFIIMDVERRVAESASRERSRIKEEVEKMKVAYEKEYDYWPARALLMACDDFLTLLTEK